jgi:hypothetical protein
MIDENGFIKYKGAVEFVEKQKKKIETVDF